jgi:putative endonuclease
MTQARHILGQYGEQAATEFLTSIGHEILDRNWSCPSGELDIVSSDGKILVFTEVKTRNGRGFGHPFEAITETKIGRMRRTAAAWLSAKQLGSVAVRFDAISVLVQNGRVAIEHIKQVF